jgi:hypothetical protein
MGNSLKIATIRETEDGEQNRAYIDSVSEWSSDRYNALSLGASLNSRRRGQPEGEISVA